MLRRRQNLLPVWVAIFPLFVADDDDDNNNNKNKDETQLRLSTWVWSGDLRVASKCKCHCCTLFGCFLLPLGQPHKSLLRDQHTHTHEPQQTLFASCCRESTHEGEKTTANEQFAGSLFKCTENFWANLPLSHTKSCCLRRRRRSVSFAQFAHCTFVCLSVRLLNAVVCLPVRASAHQRSLAELVCLRVRHSAEI